MTMPVAGLMQTLGDFLVVGIVLGMVAFGASSGLFVATLTGMQALCVLVVALGFAEPFGALLISLDMPPAYAFSAAFSLLAIGVAVAIRLLIGRYVAADAVEFEPIIEKAGGGLLGGIAGIVVAGTVLLALSILPLPESLRLDAAELRFDLGSRMLRTFARVAIPDTAQRTILLDGDAVSETGDSWKVLGVDQETGQVAYPKRDPPAEPPADGSAPPAPGPPAPPGLWSEPFADINGNGKYEDGEPYLDLLADRQFNKAAIYPPKSYPDHTYVGPKEKFFVGLRDRYRFHEWERWQMVEATWEDIDAATGTAGTVETTSETAVDPAADAAAPD